MFKRSFIPGSKGPEAESPQQHAQQGTGALPSLPSYPPTSIHEINGLPKDWKEALYRVLIPSNLLIRFGINPIRLTTEADHSAVSMRHGPSSSAVQVQVRHRADAEDPIFLLELQDNPVGHILVAYMATNDPSSPRFNIDRGEDGLPTLLGNLRRNTREEERSMRAGLAPGQVRKGLRLMRSVMPRVEAFLVILGQDGVIVEPMAYHNAILFERYGFVYTAGQTEMEAIHEDFKPSGRLALRLDGSTPFRMPEAANSVRGRSWAIHDGVLGQPWDGVKMIKRLGLPKAADTAPGLPW
jgi:hypothetical protein